MIKKNYLTFLYSLFPQHLISTVVGWLATCRLGFIKNVVIAWFIRHYRVNMQEANLENYRDYPNFNAFFTRELKEGARPIKINERAIISPVDGYISELGQLKHDQLLQAKGQYYSVNRLLANDQTLAKTFYNGVFMTAYLSPRDYHHIHMPIAGTLIQYIYVPGKLFPVKPQAVQHVDHLFARNERIICLLDTALGPVAVIAIGALLVGSMSVITQSGKMRQIKSKKITHTTYGEEQLIFNQGANLAHFNMGSSVILLFPPNTIEWRSLTVKSSLKMGQVIADVVAL